MERHGCSGMFHSRPLLFAHLPTIETERLILRKVVPADAADLFAYGRDPEVARHVLWDAYRSEAEARMYVRYLQRQYRGDQPTSWGIVHKTDRKMIGTIGFMWWNHDHNSTEVGYSLSRSYWNHGYMSEALSPIIDFAFEQMCVHRVEAQHESDNPASGRVMEKVGMCYEGTLRGRVYNKGRYADMALYAITEDMWRTSTVPTEGGAHG